jgi:hypothetical protein
LEISVGKQSPAVWPFGHFIAGGLTVTVAVALTRHQPQRQDHREFDE